MANAADAEELATLARNLAVATDDQIRRLSATAIDDLIDLVRGIAGSSFGVEAAAAIAAELHKRNQAQPIVPSPVVGNC